ncbi:MAG: hypothetical protein ACRERE_29880, partial [Candidatus Entotheonellia bacterium]
MLWWMAQVPLVLGFCETTGLDAATVILVIAGVPRLLHRGLGQEHRVAARAVVPPRPLAPHDRLVQPGGTRLMRPPLGAQGRPRQPCRRVDGYPCDGQGPLRAGIDPHDRLPAVDGHLALLPAALRVRALPLTGRLATAFVRGRRVQLGGRDHPRDRGAQAARLGQGPHGAVEPDLQVEAPQRPPALAAVIQQGPFVQAIPSGDHWLAVQAPGHTRLIAAGRLPTPPFRQVLRACFAGLAPDAPAALACLSARAERRPPIKGCADIGTSG